MGRKSSIEKLPLEVRSHIEKRLRQNKLTLDQLISDLQETFPNKDKPSRSSLGRYRQNFETMVARMREQETMARILVDELGENPDDKAGALMVQSLTTLVNRAVFEAQDDEDLCIEDVRKLARAAKEAIQARKMSLDERQLIAKQARETLIAEQEKSLEEMRGTDGMSEKIENRIKKVLLGKA